MTNIFVTADMHFDHANIINLSKRPFVDIKNMNESLVDFWNQNVKEDDVVYHLGDFILSKNSKAKDFEKLLNGTIIHIKGNHDKDSLITTMLKIGLCEFGGYVFLMQHEPPMMALEIPDDCDFVLCGHMHEKWTYCTDLQVPIINVGIDSWNYKPVNMIDVISFYEKIKG